MKRLKRLTPYIVVSLISIMIGVTLVGCGGGPSGNPQAGDTSFMNQLKPPTAQAQVSEARNTPIVKAVQAVGSTVVGITNKAVARDFFNRKVVVEQGVGSGVIFDANGYIVTNNHVVEGAAEIVVSLADGRTVNGTVVGTDPATDLAVVKIEASDLPVATLGDSDSLMVGEPAIAIGNPLGLEFKGTVTVGVISAVNRTLDFGDRRFKLIQTDAAINPGNSGGALVNADGVVVGINSSKISATGVEGIGFAIPVNTARPILQSLIDKGRVIRAYLGIGALDKNTAAKYGYELNIEKGIYLAKVYPNGPAAKVGIQEGDVILSVAGTETNSVPDLRAVLDNQQVGSRVAVVIQRNGRTQTINVALEEMPQQQ
ncbi:MAG TPA: trypsin-like peptidase domain-containing protein [Methylomusa anaerophila]|uniref:Putative serine protease HtrA n=1 Tax=Methylomusa anaerophila TaxID=1930071 RepID=A0A348AGN2_9FIRM|nr:trypsin-like peptidase domain-containing protein [Methylomusa anaerophila]BBB90230.1 putative serine protease HtrA [Methylomusa anaerophila]HML89422.1 trypsin-like peptidase domain-containing protein [Methylomusa anaerophila]